MLFGVIQLNVKINFQLFVAIQKQNKNIRCVIVEKDPFVLFKSGAQILSYVIY